MKLKLLDRRKEDVFFEHDDWVGVKKLGNITVCRKKRFGGSIKVKMLSRDEVSVYELDPNKKWYMHLGDGDINECNVMETRKDNYDSIRESIGRLRDYINLNVRDPKKCRWFTATYRQRENMDEEATPMRDAKRLYLDFKHFIARLREAYFDFHIEYIAVAEPQGSGSWHMHAILIFDKDAPYISKRDLREIYWRKGFVDINAVGGNCDNIGAYFSAYLTDLELKDGAEPGEDEEVMEKTVKGQKKKYIKGGRLHFYPPKFNLYRISSGIEAPEELEGHYSAFDFSDCGAVTYEEEIVMCDEDNPRSVLIYKYRYYNKLREPDPEEEARRSKEESIRRRLYRFARGQTEKISA